jgi:hypothetical protein
MRYSSYSFTTSELDGGEWSASRPGRGLPPRKGPPVPIVQETGWAPNREEISSCLWLDIVRVITLGKMIGRRATRMGVRRKVYRMLEIKPERTRQLG